MRALSFFLFALCCGCANGGDCQFDRDCDELMYCSDGFCVRDCIVDAQCGPGRICTSRGLCIDGFRDAGPDAPDAPTSDVPMALDTPAPIDAPLGMDVPLGVDAPLGMDAPIGVDVPSIDAPIDGGVDAPRDSGVDAPADAGVDAPRDAGSATPGPGTYTYRALAVGGLSDTVAVAFHPDGSYAIVLERSDEVHVIDWASGTATRFDLRVASRAISLDDILFSPDGSTAWIVGYERISSTDSGVIIRFDDAAYRRGDGLASFTRLGVTLGGERPAGIELPRAASGGPASGHPILLTQSGTSPYIARLRDLDPATGAFGSFVLARATGAGCDDLTFVDNEFGGWGILLACGTNGAEILYYTDIAGVPEWRPGTGGFGNVSRTDAHPSAAYALIVNWSSDRLYRHATGALVPTGGSPSVASGIFDVSFSGDGRFGLITGRALGTMLRGTIYEYRHDLYTRSEITDVSIDGFALAPYLGTTNTSLTDSAWRPGCDGGLVVGGQLTPTSRGLVIEFQRAGGVACR